LQIDASKEFKTGSKSFTENNPNLNGKYFIISSGNINYTKAQLNDQIIKCLRCKLNIKA